MNQLLIKTGNQTPEVILRERLEKTWATLGEALSSVRSINNKLFVPVPCETSNEEIKGADTSNVESLICLIESAAGRLDIETQKISNRI